MGRKISEWMVLDGHGAGRVLLGTDPTKIENRVAFIEKTPRVRIRDMSHTQDNYGRSNDWLNWAESTCKGDDANDPESREWCDRMLAMLGYEFTDEDARVRQAFDALDVSAFNAFEKGWSAGKSDLMQHYNRPGN